MSVGQPDFSSQTTEGKKEKQIMSSNTFSSPSNEQVPYTIALTNPDSSAYVFQPGDVAALVSTDGHSTVAPNAADPTGETGFVSDTASFAGPVSGTMTFTPGPANTTVAPASGTWSGTWDAVTETLNIVVNFGTPVAPAAGKFQLKGSAKSAAPAIKLGKLLFTDGKVALYAVADVAANMRKTRF
jgi:hypothetical protein